MHDARMPIHRPRLITMTTMNPKTATAMLGHPGDEGVLCEMTNQTGSKLLSDEERRQKIAAERTLAAPLSVGLPQPPALQSQAIAAAVTVPAAGTLPQRESSDMLCFNSIQCTSADLGVTELAGWQATTSSYPSETATGRTGKSKSTTMETAKGRMSLKTATGSSLKSLIPTAHKNPGSETG